MERVVTLRIEKLPEGSYLATSDGIQGLIAQGRTIQETIEIAHDVAKKLLEAQGRQTAGDDLRTAGDSFEFPMILSV
jgi:predicted RNase H-like HicB family nuclease